jgi:hypothetical protein
MALMRDPLTGAVILPGRTTRTYLDTVVPGTNAVASFWTVVAGTLSVQSGWSGTSTGRMTLTTGATSGNAAAIKGNAPFNVITPGNFLALGMRLECFSLDTDNVVDIEFGFQGNVGGKGGCELIHLNGATQAIVRTKDAAAVATDLAVNYTYLGVSGAGRSRRNLTFWLFPYGYAGAGAAVGSTPTPYAYLLEDDQVVVEAALPNFDRTQTTVPIFAVTTREAVAHSMSWVQTSLIVNQN